MDGSKTKRQTNKNTWTPIHTHEQPWTSMDTHEHLSAHEHPWIHMNSCFSKYNAAGKLLVEPYASQFLNSYFGLLAMRFFDLIINVLLLNWTLFLFLCFFVLSCGGFAPRKKILADLCKTWLFIFIFIIYIYLFIYCFYLFKFEYIYIYTMGFQRVALWCQNLSSLRVCHHDTP